MKRMTIFLSIIFVFNFLILVNFSQAQQDNPKNIIFFIGDGMGVSALSLAALVSDVQDANLSITKMPVTGYSFTYSSDMVVTDSAAAGTALATGFKTKNHMLSIKQDGTKIKSILEHAKDKGFSTGVVTTTYVCHATPAAFAAHSISRNSTNQIARDMLDNNLDIIFGGGLKYFKSNRLERKSKPVNILEKAVKNGYQIVYTRNDLLSLSSDSSKVIGLFTKSHMSYEIDRDSSKEPSLSEMTEKAINILNYKKKPFFLMVEGGKIDHAAHGHDAPTIVKDVQAFDKAVKVALDFAKKNSNTLIVVTADHETAGLSILERVDLRAFSLVKGSVEHAAVNIKNKKITAENAKRDFFPFPAIDADELKRCASTSLGYNTFLDFGNLISNHLGVFFIPNAEQIKSKNTFGHTASMVPVFAFGPGANLFTGVYDNTDIPRKMASLLGLKLDSGIRNIKIPVKDE